jgi:hypothetical protein
MPRRIFVKPIPPVDKNTSWISAGPVIFGIEYRHLDPADLGDYREVQNVELPTEPDEGISLHVLSTADSNEVLRFDCFTDKPHYHYICWSDPVVIERWDFDQSANGDMLEWVFHVIRTRLPELTEAAGDAALAERVRRDESWVSKLEDAELAAQQSLTAASR